MQQWERKERKEGLNERTHARRIIHKKKSVFHFVPAGEILIQIGSDRRGEKEVSREQDQTSPCTGGEWWENEGLQSTWSFDCQRSAWGRERERVRGCCCCRCRHAVSSSRRRAERERVEERGRSCCLPAVGLLFLLQILLFSPSLTRLRRRFIVFLLMKTIILPSDSRLEGAKERQKEPLHPGSPSYWMHDLITQLAITRNSIFCSDHQNE